MDLLSKMDSILDKLVFQNEVQRLLYKLVLVTDPFYHSERIYNPSKSNFGILQKPTKLNLFLFNKIT